MNNMEEIMSLNEKAPIVNRAKLPDSMQEFALRDLKMGDRRWTSPNAITVDCDGYMYVQGFYTGYLDRGSSAKLQVYRTTEGFSVDFTHCQDQKYMRELSYNTGGIPVTSITGIKEPEPNGKSIKLASIIGVQDGPIRPILMEQALRDMSALGNTIPVQGFTQPIGKWSGQGVAIEWNDLHESTKTN